jgi:hypothetical protein
MTKTLHGIVRGKSIEFQEDLGVAEGHPVEVQRTVIQHTKKWGQGIRRSAGGWAAYPEMDAVMEQIHQERRQ